MKAVVTLAAVATVLAAGAASATSTKLLSLDQLIQQSSKVVAADVTAKEAVWKGRFLKTRVKLKVADCMKGACEEEEVEVESWGGDKDGITMRVDGSPQFAVGEKVVVFLRSLGGTDTNAGGTLHTVGMAQGKFVPAFGATGALTRDQTGLKLVGALAPPIEGTADEPDAGVLEDDPDQAGRIPRPGVDSLQGLTMAKLKGRIGKLVSVTPPDGVSPDRLGAERTVREGQLDAPIKPKPDLP